MNDEEIIYRMILSYYDCFVAVVVSLLFKAFSTALSKPFAGCPCHTITPSLSTTNAHGILLVG